MAIEQRLQWIALPAGANEDGTELRLSVMVAPRLRSADTMTLAPFADFLDWPARVGAAAFVVELAGGVELAARVVSPAPDSALWAALFGPATPLAPFVFDDIADRPFVSFSVGAVLGELRRIYTQVAADWPAELPSIATDNDQARRLSLVRRFEAIREVARRVPFGEGVTDGESLDARIRGVLGEARGESARRRALVGPRSLEPNVPLRGDGGQPVTREFERALLFHRRPADAVEMPPDEQSAAELFTATVDFHQMLSALGDHPELLRRLGLVIDLAVPAADIPHANYPAPLQLRVRPTWASLLEPGQSHDVTPPTACIHTIAGGETLFAAAERAPNPAGPAHAPPTGLLALPPARFRIEQVDVDGGALKALNLAATLNRVADRAPNVPEEHPLEEPEQAGLPALRTGGLALVHARRPQALQGEFGQAVRVNAAAEGGPPVTLHAEDLLRGYRLDVWDGSAWRSLHERDVTYVMASIDTSIAVSDEGFFQLSLAGKATPPGAQPDRDGELYIHETLVTWDGWSLSAARPGKALSRDVRAPADDAPETQPQRIVNEPLTAMGLQIDTAARPGSLPRLRFGSSYRCRLRTVDLAGNGVEIATADRRLALAETDTPVVPVAGATDYLRFEPVPAPALVPRARYGEGASLLRLVVRSNVGVSAVDYAAAFNDSELVVEGAHGRYDAFDDRHVVPPKASLQTVEAHGLLDAVIGADGAPPDADAVAAMRAMYEIARREKASLDELNTDPDNPQGYVVVADEDLVLPYLPDPLATGAVFMDLPGQPAGQPFVVDFGGPAWHQPTPFRLRLVEGAQAPQWDPERRVLSVALAPATVAAARVCSFLGGALDLMGIMRWCEQELAGDRLDRVIQAARENACWLLTPWHELKLVHAVQQPLMVPEFAEFELSRDHDATLAHVFGTTAVDPASTEKIDLVATWQEQVDDVRLPGPHTYDSEQVVFSLPLAVAATTPAGHAPPDAPYTLRDGILTFNSRMALRRGLATPGAHQFGDTKHRRVAYRAVATTPFREYFPAQWAQPADPRGPARRPELSVDSLVQEVDVPSSAPPAPPRVQYVVPTLGWETRNGGDGGLRRLRRGGGLRVYLSRPWFSSGDGELLGIVVGGGLISPRADEYRYVTLLGKDPIRDAAALESARPRLFRNAVTTAPRVQLLELPNQFVTIMGFAVEYDPESRRWFCDIDLDTQSAYLPFVRLALVRYQASSLERCHVSQVVLCDLVQPLPDRTLSVLRDAAEPASVSIRVAGPSYNAVSGPFGRRDDPPALGRVVARLEQRDPAIADDLLGWLAVEGAELELQRGVDAAGTTWSGALAVAENAGGLAQRVAVVEYDHLIGDQETASASGFVERVVYADAVEL